METQPEPREEHRWLQQLLGRWTFGDEGEDAPHPPWKETVRPLGDLWVIAEGAGLMPDGTPGSTQMTLGYDPARERFVGTFVGSMMTHLWVYSGALDAGGHVLTLETEGPDMESEEERMVRYQDVIELRDGRRSITSLMQQPDGSWQEFMRMEYRRVGEGEGEGEPALAEEGAVPARGS